MTKCALGVLCLQPECVYEVRLKSGDVNQHIERSAPKSRTLTIKDQDLTNVNIIAFRRMNQLDLSGNVITEDTHLHTLKVGVIWNYITGQLVKAKVRKTCKGYSMDTPAENSSFLCGNKEVFPLALSRSTFIMFTHVQTFE